MNRKIDPRAKTSPKAGQPDVFKPGDVIEAGSHVSIRPGTELRYREAGDPTADWTSAVEGDLDDFGLEAPVYRVDRIGPSHSTMTGGGRDYYLTDGHYDVVVRTTFAQDERACFEGVRAGADRG